MKKNSYSHIRKWLWIYMLLVILTTIATYLLIYQEITDSLAMHGVLRAGAASAAEFEASYKAWQVGLRLRLLLLLTAGIAIVGGFGFLWVRLVARKMSRPIGIIHRAVFRLASGKLNETVDIETADEFGQIGSGINELAANLQELLLYIWKQTGQCSRHVQEIQGEVTTNCSTAMGSDNLKQLNELSEAIQDLRKMAKAYVFFDVRLEGEQTMAINEPGQTLPDQDEQ